MAVFVSVAPKLLRNQWRHVAAPPQGGGRCSCRCPVVSAAAIEAQPGVANGAAVRWRGWLCGSAPVRSPRSVLTVALLCWMGAEHPPPPLPPHSRGQREACGMMSQVSTCCLPAHGDCRVNGLNQCSYFTLLIFSFFLFGLEIFLPVFSPQSGKVQLGLLRTFPDIRLPTIS